MSHTTDYFLGESTVEAERLVAMARAFEPDARAFIDSIGIEPGCSAVDIGCGPAGILHLLAEAVGPQGTVVGLERAENFAELARRGCEERGLTNVRMELSDVRENQLPAGTFDLAHERLVLIQAPEPDLVLRKMRDLVRPGGIVAAEELDAASWCCYPSHPAWDQLFAAFRHVATNGGANVNYGRRLPGMLRAAGLVDVRVEARVGVPAPGDEYLRTHLIALTTSVRDDVLGQGLLSQSQWDDHVAELTAHLEDPDTVVVTQTTFQAWGRRPA